MEQQNRFTQGEHRAKKQETRRERFLAGMEKLVPWQALVEIIAPFYFRRARGRPPMGVEETLRAYVEHPFHIRKNLFKHCKVRDRGLAENIAQLYTLFALANLVIARPCLRATSER